MSVLTGTTGQWLVTIQNDGGHDVTVDGVDAQWPAVSAQWSEYHFTPGGWGMGDERPAQSFPAPIRGGDQIRVQLDISRPTCLDGDTEIVDGIIVRWHALGVHHSTPLSLRIDADHGGILLCGSVPLS